MTANEEPCIHTPEVLDIMTRWNMARWQEIKEHRGIGTIIAFSVLHKCSKCGVIYGMQEKRKVLS